MLLAVREGVQESTFESTKSPFCSSFPVGIFVEWPFLRVKLCPDSFCQSSSYRNPVTTTKRVTAMEAFIV